MTVENVANSELQKALKAGQDRGWLLLHMQPSCWSHADAPKTAESPLIKSLSVCVQWTLVWEGR